MLKIKSISLSTAQYSDAYETTVTFQVGHQAYNTVKVNLTPEMTREILELAVRRATEMLVVSSNDIAVHGESLPLIEEAPVPDPEFAEVDETPDPVIYPEPFPAPEPMPVEI